MAWHDEITGSDAIHPIMYVQSSDPGAVGADKFWLDTTGGATLDAGAVLKQRDGTNSSWTTRCDLTKQAEVLMIAVSDETTAITTGTAKVVFRMPFAMHLTEVRASLTGSSSSGAPAIDVNESGVSIFSTTLTIDQGEKTSTTAATPAVISDADLADDAEMTIDVDTAGTGATGLKVYLIGRRA